MPPKVGAVKRMHQGQAYQYSLFLTVGKTGRLDKGRLCGCAIGQDFQSRSCLHTIFATENDDDFAGKPFRKERETVVAGEVKVQSVHQHNGVRSGCKSARIGRNCQVSRSGWIEAVTNGTQTKRVWYRRGEYQRSGDKRRNGVSGCCHVPVRQKE